LAPTSVLAAQHFATLRNLLPNLNIALLIGSTKAKDNLKADLKSGKVDILVGTHAILTDNTEFSRLGLVVIDEQHRFGVEQRQKLLLKSGAILPHLLSMTATPIPRTLQLTLFGDLSISSLRQLPRGREPVATKIINKTSLSDLWPTLLPELEKHHQIYYICKMIDDNSISEIANVERETKKLCEKPILKPYRIAYLHGKMKPAEKDEVMGRFKRHEIDLLVSTTVVEVGIDVPNATVIIILDADKYGLAQLHQLRGRVGRGDTKSYCYLINSNSDQIPRRLLEMQKSTDGFYLAEVDLKLRGPGAIYGTLQHGILDLKIANISDAKLISKVAKDLDNLLQTPNNLLNYPELAENVMKYQKLTNLN
jgi:ATP-dependent DNA helicase RecG